MAEAVIRISEKRKERLSEMYNLIEGAGAKVVKEEWHSIYNSYVFYDYEPFCSDGYDIHLIVKGSKTTLAYLTYLIAKDRAEREHLENCYNKPAVAMGVI